MTRHLPSALACLLFLALVFALLAVSGCAQSNPLAAEDFAGDRHDITQTLTFPGEVEIETDETKLTLGPILDESGNPIAAKLTVNAGIVQLQLVEGTAANSTVPVTFSPTGDASTPITPQVNAAITGQGGSTVEGENTQPSASTPDPDPADGEPDSSIE